MTGPSHNQEDQQKAEPPREVMVSGSASTGNVGQDGHVAGVNIENLKADNVTIHQNSPTTSSPSQSARSIIITGFLAFFIAALTNIATGVIPEAWKPYLWIAWPLAGIFTLVSIWYALHERRSADVQRITVHSKDRTAMLRLVQITWIDGVLKQSLWNEARIALHLAARPDAAARPYSLTLLSPTDESLLTSTLSIIDIYDTQQATLLILGEPGGGKTTVLLELAEVLLKRATTDTEMPIPVIFNLSSWGREQQPLGEWLIQQMDREYDAPKKIAREWVTTGAVLPLLDGLDEVAADKRALCVAAINTYRKQHEQTWGVPIIVCCRTKEYDNLPPLRQFYAVVVQNLTRQQIDGYLYNGGRALAGVRAVVKDDPIVYALLETPLLLNVVTITFADKAATELRRTGTVEERRDVLFAAYVERVFKPPPDGKGEHPRYPKAHTIHFLGQLARQMQQHSQSVYFIEEMQRDWLASQWGRWLAYWGTVLVGGLYLWTGRRAAHRAGQRAVLWTGRRAAHRAA